MIKIIATVQGGVIQDLEAQDENREPLDSETEIIDMDGCEEEDDFPFHDNPDGSINFDYLDAIERKVSK